MNNLDTIQRFIFTHANVRGEIVKLHHSYQTIMEQHQYPPHIRTLLGEFLAVAPLLSSIIKFKGRLTVQFQGKDPLKLLLAQCNNQFKIRGLAQWQGDLSQQDISSGLEKGTLAIIIQQDANTTPYQGIVAWQGNSLVQSIEGYFKDSEQLPTRLWLAVNETTAAGLLLQSLPENSTQKHQPIKTGNDWEHLIHLTETLTSDELLTLDTQVLLHRLYSQEEINLFPPAEVTFGCTCSIERSENAIRLLGKDEAEEELQNKQVLIVTCEFCSKEYSFDKVDVTQIFKKMDDSSSPTH